MHTTLWITDIDVCNGTEDIGIQNEGLQETSADHVTNLEVRSRIEGRIKLEKLITC